MAVYAVAQRGEPPENKILLLFANNRSINTKTKLDLTKLFYSSEFHNSFLLVPQM